MIPLCRIFMIVVLLFVIVIPCCVLSQSNTPATNNNSVAHSEQASPANKERGFNKDISVGFSTQTIYDLFYLCEEIGYLLALDFILGMLFICQQWFVIKRERDQAKKVPIDKIKSLAIEDLRQMFTKVEVEKGSSVETKQMEKIPLLRKIFKKRKASAYQLLQKLYKIFESQHSTAGFGDEISSYKQYLKDLFNPFLTRLMFFSDTAGALGLLGTVWGMFLVFYKGSPDQNEILAGMGIALATTIVGLVISIILNTLVTVISNMFDSYLDRIDKMGNIFFDRLLKEEVKQPAIPIQVVSQPYVIEKENLQREHIRAAAEAKIEAKKKVETAKKVEPELLIYGKPAELKIISGDNQSGMVNSLLDKPFVIEIRDQNGNLLENETVTFIAEDGAGIFVNENKIHKILTDEEGRAQTQLLLGKKAGEKTIRVSVERGENLGLTFLVVARPTPPEKFIEIDGNYQTGELDRRLSKPFIVAVRDKYDNPISRHEIHFHLKKGTGKFQDSLNAHYTTTTNEDGLVEVYFIMGNNRGAREIEVETSKVEPSKIKFEVFAI